MTLPSGVVLAGGTYKNIALGGAKTASVAVNTALTSATGNIAVQAIGDISGSGNLSTTAANMGVTFTTASGTGASAYTGIISGATGVTKAGAGAQTLSGVNTYTGTTTVSAGTLKAGVASVAGTSGAFGKNSAVSVASGATLEGAPSFGKKPVSPIWSDMAEAG